MKKTKLLKTLLIPTLGIAAIGTVVTVATSCGSDPKPTPSLNDVVNVTANENSTLTLINENDNNPNLEYSTDGEHWAGYTQVLEIPANSKLYLRGNNPDGWSHSDENYSSLEFTGKVSIFGNVMGLLDNGAKPGETGDIIDMPCDFCFSYLFYNSTGIRHIGKYFLPATTLTQSCYEHMFHGSSNLIDLPELPATTLTQRCYQYMFEDCLSLEQMPNLPATTLAENCYTHMFTECSNLTSVCISATTLAPSCFLSMFYLCTSLNSIRIDYTGTVADAPNGSFYNWVKKIGDTGGVFYYKGEDTLANFGFPANWSINPN